MNLYNLNNIDVVVLCGGLGTRLRAEIGDAQKTMATVDGRPFLEILLKYISHQGFSRVILCTGYQGQEVEAYFKGRDSGLQVEFAREPEPLGTGGAVKAAKELIKSDPFFVLNGDSFCPVDYKKFFAFHLNQKACVSITIAESEERKDFGSICLNKDQTISSFKEKNEEDAEGKKAGFVNAGVYCFSRQVFDRMPEAGTFSLEKDLFPSILKKNLFGFLVAEPFVDIGTPDRYKKAQELLKKLEENFE